MITHDKRGNPLHPTVQEILNLEVPLKPKRRRAPSMQRRQVPLPKVPDLTEVPSLETETRIEGPGPVDTAPAPAQPSELLVEPQALPDAGTTPAGLSASPPKALAWLLSFLSKPAAVSVNLDEKPLEANVQLDFPQHTGCAVAEPEPQRPAPLLMNSAFYRVLALETQMCQKGKLDAPNVAMAIYKERQPPKPRVWVDLAAT